MTPAEQEDLAYDHIAEIDARERARWPEGDLAYDGSAWPMRRELTPRERDVLTRIIGGWWHTIIEIDAEQRGIRPQYVGAQIDLTAHVRPAEVGGLMLTTNPLVDDPRVAWLRMDVAECQMLLNLRPILTPRQE